MSRMLAVISGIGLALCAGFLALAWWIGGDDVFHDPRSLQSLKPLIDLATHKEWRWAGGDTLALDTPMTLRYEPQGKPGIAVTGPADTVKHVRFRDGRIGADMAAAPRGKEKLQAVVRGVPIRKFVVNGGENLELGHIEQEELSLYVNGGGTVSGDGRVDDLTLVMNGPGMANLGNLSVNNDAKVSVLGPGEVTLSPHGDLKLFLAGNAHVVLKTKPDSIKRTVLGNATIETPDGVEAISPVPPRFRTPPTPPTPMTPPTPATPGGMVLPVPAPLSLGSARENVEVRGSKDVDLGHLDQQRLVLTLFGSGSVEAEGRVDDLIVNVMESGSADLGAVSARKVTVHVMHSGNATISPGQEADISIMGSGNVTLMSKPRTIRRSILGSGEIIGAR